MTVFGHKTPKMALYEANKRKLTHRAMSLWEEAEAADAAIAEAALPARPQSGRRPRAAAFFAMGD
jgi:hypothetical protein